MRSITSAIWATASSHHAARAARGTSASASATTSPGSAGVRENTKTSPPVTSVPARHVQNQLVPGGAMAEVSQNQSRAVTKLRTGSNATLSSPQTATAMPAMSPEETARGIARRASRRASAKAIQAPPARPTATARAIHTAVGSPTASGSSQSSAASGATWVASSAVDGSRPSASTRSGSAAIPPSASTFTDSGSARTPRAPAQKSTALSRTGRQTRTAHGSGVSGARGGWSTTSFSISSRMRSGMCAGMSNWSWTIFCR